jgi:hypothetical protein
VAGKGRPFQKGQSGNPGGRAKGAGLADYIRTQTKDGRELADFMVAILRNDKDGELGGRVPLPVRMEAATWLADRGFGKPVQATELNADVNVSGRIVYAPALATIPEGT